MAKVFIHGTREAGAVLNKENRSALKKAFDTIASVLKAAGIDLTAAEDAPADAAPKEAASVDTTSIIEAAGFSMTDLAALLQDALIGLQVSMQGDQPQGDMIDQPYSEKWRLIDIYDTNFIYCESWSSTTYYQVDYTVADDGSVSLGTPIFVIRKVSYITPGAQASESASADQSTVDQAGAFDMPLTAGAPLRLVESAIAADGTVKIKLIAANNWGSSGYYSADVLKRDGATAFPIGTKMYIDHDTPAEESARPEGTITRLAATFTTAAQYERNTKHGDGLYAMARVREVLRTDLDDIAPSIGTSIKASGKAVIGVADGRKGPIITALSPSVFNRVDFVTIPGAGGKLVPLFESLRTRAQADDPGAGDIVTVANDGRLIETISIGDQTMTDEQIRQLISDGVTAALVAALPAALSEAQAPISQQLARLTEAATLREADTIVSAHLGKISGLPALTRQRLTPIIVREATVKDGALDIAALLARADTLVREEAQYIEGIGGARIVGLGESTSIDHVDSDAPAEEAFNAELSRTFVDWGLSENAAKIAANGRARA